jgi:hypothetical protein
MTATIQRSNRSPGIEHVSCGRLEDKGESEPHKDANLFSVGSREWNWRETKNLLTSRVFKVCRRKILWRFTTTETEAVGGFPRRRAKGE